MAAFDGFVILADMRTGSNALEERLNDFVGVRSHGELFNPHFIGKPKVDAAFGMTLAERDAAPVRLIAAARGATDGLAGFRLFSDHDPRVLDHVLGDARTAKVVLTRPALDSYVSLKIARTTGQWWLGDLKRAKAGKARFDAAEFEAFEAARARYLAQIRRQVQVTGQTAFEIAHGEIDDADVLRGLALFLGATGEMREGGAKGRRQNPVPMSERVANFAEMKAALAARDPLDLDGLADVEVSRGAAVPSYMAVPGVLYLPVPCAADREVTAWLSALADCAPEQGFTQKSLRQWKRKQGRHVSFTVVAHPLARAHEAFCRHVLPTGGESYVAVREVLARSYGVPLPDDPEDTGYDAAAHGAAFLAFLKFLKGNLAGQTAVRVDAAWASQTAVTQGFAAFGVPDRVIRAEDLSRALPEIAERAGATAAPPPEPASGRFTLGDIHAERLEDAARAAYQKDYMMFGYGPWEGGAPRG